MLKRIVLYLLTNLAVMALLAVVFMLASRLGLFGDLSPSMVQLIALSTIYGFAGSIVSLFLSKLVAKMATGAEVITAPRNEVEAWLLQTVARQAKAAGIATPEVAIYDSPELNAFATGATRNSALVAVSTGLLSGMRRDEVEAVLAHEVSHAANGDMVTLALMQGVLNTFVLFFSRVIGTLVDRTVFRTERGRGLGYWIVVVIAELVLGILATLIVMAFSRWRELRADAGSARLVGAPKMIAALERLAREEGSDLPDSVAAFGIQGGGGGLLGLFRSHPPIQQRIAALRALMAR